MSCCGVCCRKPRYKRLIDSLFPEDPQDERPVAANVDKFVYFAQSSPEDLDRMGKYLAIRLRKSLHREKNGHICVALQVTEKLLAECQQRHLQLIADSYLDMLNVMLDSSHNKMRIMAANSFVTFADCEEGNTPYHRQYDSFIHHFASLSLCANHNDPDIYQETRMAGLCGLRGVIKKIGHQDVLQLNIWDIEHLNKIVPPFLFNMQESTNDSRAEVNLVEYAEEGLKELILCAGLAHIDSVIEPILQHFDLNSLWTEHKEFSTGVFVTLVKTMQKQDRYKAIQALVLHLDNKAKESCDLKQGILDTLSQCVIVAADGSLGPSVLDVFRTLVKHLRISIQGPLSSQDEIHLSSEDSQKFQKSITKTVGEFAGVLPDYHKPDIMNLINSYMVIAEHSSNGDVAAVGSGVDLLKPTAHQGYRLATSLVQCLKAVADTYHPAILETTFPDTLFTSLVQLFTIKNSSVQLDVMVLWHQLIDHHSNREKIPLDTEWQSLEMEGLVLGKVSSLFLKKTVPTLYGHLMKLAQGLSLQLENLKAFYQLLFLLTLEFSEPGVLDMVVYLNWLQNQAVGSDSALTVAHRNAFHAIVAGVLYLISHISSASGLQEHILKVLAIRKASAPHLMPGKLFTPEDKSDGVETLMVKSHLVDKMMLFILDEEELLRRTPEPRKGFVRFGRDSSSSGPDLSSHFSVSLDYGSDSPLSVDQISFNSLKEKAVSGEAVEVGGTEQTAFEVVSSLSYQEAVGKASNSEQLCAGFNLADMLSVAITPASSNTTANNDQHRNSSAYDMELPSLH